MVDDYIRPSKPGNKNVKSDIEDTEPFFAPPETVANQDLPAEAAAKGEEIIDMAGESTVHSPQSTDKKSNKNPLAAIVALKEWWQKRTKKQQIIAAIAGFAIILLVVGGFLVLHKKPAPKAAPVAVKKEEKKEPPKPTTEPSHLTGVQVPLEYNLLPVTAIMIENSPDARPQSGLKDAGVVFEAIAEGGITRFLTLFQEAQPDYVGPVRSVRPYYVDWLQGFDAAVGHVGGSGEALGKIQAEGVKDLDQFYNGGAYQRIPQRYAPHNVYTSLGGLLAIEKSKGWTSSSFTGFVRKAEKPVTTPPAAKSLDFVISGPLYNAHYDYDAASNSYKRSEGGKPHVDERSGQQLSPKVVIALVTAQGINADGIHTTYNTIGSGQAYIFQDGGVTVGTWSKTSPKDQVKFGDANGAPMGINPGQTWISVVGNPGNVSYRP